MKTLISGLSKKERELLIQVRKSKLSPSHNLDHLKNVLFYALKLAKIYKAEQKILVPACLLHDLGRSKSGLHGKGSIKESCRQAKMLLKKAGYSPEEVKLICQVIAEHDQPKHKAKNLEAKILKEADFLDGFGARGILRAVYWLGESGKPFEKTLGQLQKKMKQRYESLEFPESQQIAASQLLFAQVFFDYLKDIRSQPLSFKGRYIVFEGISGTGKETQAKMLKEFFKEKGLKAEIFYHPTQRLKETLKIWRKDKTDSFTEALMFVADRHDVVSRFLWPALKKGKVVISLRNKISTLVYQAKTKEQVNLFEYLYSLFEPEPEIIFYFELKPEEALKRVLKRTRKTGEEREKFENIRDLREKRKKYQKIIKRYKGVVTLDASVSQEQMQKRIIDCLKERGLV